MESFIKAGVGVHSAPATNQERKVTIITTKEKTRFRPIFSLRIAGHLMTLGFPLLDMRENEKYAGRLVYYFVDSNQLDEAIQNYLNSR